MSWEVLGVVARKRWGGQTRRLLALTMADKANKDGSGVYASVRSMARDAEVSEATARRTLREFERDGVIVKVGERSCLNGHTNIYDLQLDAILAMADLEPPKPHRAHGEPPVRARGVSRRSPKPLGDQAPLAAIETPITVTPLSQRAQTGLTVIANPILDPKEQESCSPETDLFGHTEPSKPKAKRAKTPYSAEFEAFWKSWPQGRRENSDKKTAFRRWKDATAGGLTPATIMGAAKHYLGKREVAKEDYRFCVLAEVFLNGKLDAAVEAFQAHAPDDANLARVRLELFNKFGRWHAEWGPRPDGEPSP